MAEAKKELRYMNEEELAAFRKSFGAATFDPTSVKRRHTDIAYGNQPEQMLDIYLPGEGDGPFPVILYVHGGGWLFGTRTVCALDTVIDALERGYAVVSIDYRLVPKIIFPENLLDVKTAIRWVRACGAAYCLDGEKIMLLGDSAGGHLVLLAAYTAGDPAFSADAYGHAGVSDAVAGVAALFPPTDLSIDGDDLFRESGVKRLPPPKPEEDKVIGDAKRTNETCFGTSDPEKLYRMSPMGYVHPGIPKTLLLHGISDSLVPYQQSTLLAEKIEKICGSDRVELHLYPERNHADPAFSTRENAMLLADFYDACHI